MGRKNLLDLTLNEHPLADAVGVVDAAAGNTTAPAISSLRDSMRQLGESGVQDLDPATIEASDLRDRLSIDDASVQDLAESIRKHGQQVPVLVRPVPGRFNRYRIVYGRRRLAAVRLLGGDTRIKAIVRSLDDQSAVIAQGQENSLRLDPSFIEKCVFIGAMRDAGYDRTIIQEALGVSKQTVSTYTVVLDALPIEVIIAVGPAHEVGRRPWTELANLVKDGNVDLMAVLEASADALNKVSTSAERFEIIRDNAFSSMAGRHGGQHSARPVHHGGQRSSLTLKDGSKIGVVSAKPTSVQMQLNTKLQPEFGQWFTKNADRLIKDLHELWLKERDDRA
nr:plasmid partitioning protein RepB [Paracoccus saliphilus]